MAIDLDAQAIDVDITSAQYDPMLRNLQANILKAHGRNYARHIFVQFTAPPSAVKAWIRDSASPRVTSAKQQFDQIARRDADPAFDGGLVSGFFLSAKGYSYLGFDTGSFESHTFLQGMKDQDESFLKELFHDLLDINNKDPKPETWEEGFQRDIHALITVADTDENKVISAAAAIRAGVATIGAVLTIEEGTVLRRVKTPGDTPEPVEHFGYFDGISNPLFTRQDLQKERPENIARRDWSADASLSLVLVKDPFAEDPDAFGSYLVYRKLGQDVELFNRRVTTLANTLAMNPELTGAMVVGRFKDGTPVLGGFVPSPGPQLANDFNYQEDKDGAKCPFHAHIRKVNPRGTTPLTSSESERSRRIVRRGIPYGKPMPGVADPMPSDPNPSAPRGLLFMCFQQSVEHQFEFIQRTWADNQHFPTGIPTLGLLQQDTGDDPVIGQDRNEGQHWPNRWGNPGAGKQTFNFESAVTLKGGEYFFAPSLAFLRSI